MGGCGLEQMMDETQCSSNVLPPFLVKTYEMVDDHSSDSIFSWSQSNKSFVVWNPPEFARDLLPRFFKHNNFFSFIRQLNTYGIVATTDVVEACKGVNIVIMVGGFPRKEGMERKDVLVVANPANTNALILKEFAPSIPEKNITCLTRLDHNRALGHISERIHVHVGDVKNVIIWGNDSSTQYPDVNHATFSTGAAHKPVRELVGDDNWLKMEFITTVQQRGAAIIQARKLSSALSAASSACDHIRDWVLGTPKIDEFSRGKMDATTKELMRNLTGGGFGFSNSNFNVCGSIMCGGWMDKGYTYMDLDFNLLETSSLAFSIIVTAFTLQTKNATGLVAPAIATCLGALIHTLVTLVPMIGASGFATVAATTAIRTVVGSFR
ncbi:unnamed protein product [Camellia sinensis]